MRRFSSANSSECVQLDGNKLTSLAVTGIGGGAEVEAGAVTEAGTGADTLKTGMETFYEQCYAHCGLNMPVQV